MGVLESQQSAKFSTISHLSAKYLDISRLSVIFDKSQLIILTFCRILHSCCISKIIVKHDFQRLFVRNMFVSRGLFLKGSEK